MNEQSIEQKFAQLERIQVKLKRVLTACCLCLLVLLSIVLASFKNNSSQIIPEDSVLKLRGIILTDKNGIDRMWLGTPVDKPIVMGKRMNRGSTAHGIILLDEQGNERGSFAIHDESSSIALTMDNVSKMVYNLSTGPTGGVTEWIRDKYGNTILLATGQDGPFVKLSSKDSSILLSPKK